MWLRPAVVFFFGTVANYSRWMLPTTKTLALPTISIPRFRAELTVLPLGHVDLGLFFPGIFRLHVRPAISIRGVFLKEMPRSCQDVHSSIILDAFPEELPTFYTKKIVKR